MHLHYCPQCQDQACRRRQDDEKTAARAVAQVPRQAMALKTPHLLRRARFKQKRQKVSPCGGCFEGSIKKR